LRLEIGARTDVGRVRKNNEDCYQVDPALNLFVLSDGMGGQAHGEVASSLAVATVVEHCRAAENNRAAPTFEERRPDVSEHTNRLASAVRLANRKVFDAAGSDPSRRGMGATLVAGWIDGKRVSVANVGDSRAYLLRAGTLDQLTMDHSLVAEKVRSGMLTPQQAEESNLQSVLTRAIGTSEVVEVDADEQRLIEGDTFLLCSDGLTRMVTVPEIGSTLLTTPTAQAAADRLVELANEYGGVDNVSVIVVRVTRNPGGVLDRLKFWKRNSE